MFLLISFVILFACQNSGQQAYKDDIVPIDSTFVVTNDRHEDNVLPDSAKITIISPRFGMDSIVFSLNSATLLQIPQIRNRPHKMTQRSKR